MEQNINERARKYADELMRLYAAAKPAVNPNPPPRSADTMQAMPAMPDMTTAPPERNAAPTEVIAPSTVPLTASAKLSIEARSANEALPVAGALAVVTRGTELYGLLRTDDSGMSSVLPLPAPPLSEDNPQSEAYNVAVHADGYYSVENINAPAFADTESLIPVNMIPLPVASPPREIVFYD